MLPAATTLAVPELRLTPSSYDLIPNAGGGTEEVSFDVLITGLDATTLVAGYDFGIIYDPAHLTLAGFDGFTDRLGDESQFEVYNEDYLGDLNSLWDYRARHETLGDYTGPVVGTPVITGQGVKNEGSLRFTQASYLERMPCWPYRATAAPTASGCSPYGSRSTPRSLPRAVRSASWTTATIKTFRGPTACST